MGGETRRQSCLPPLVSMYIREMVAQSSKFVFGENKMNGLFVKTWVRWKETNKGRCGTSRTVAVQSPQRGELEGPRRQVAQESREGYSGGRGCCGLSIGTSQTPHSQGTRTVNTRSVGRLSPPALLFPAGTHRQGPDSAGTPQLRKRNWRGSYGSAPRDRASGDAGGRDREGQVDYSAD